MTGSTHHVLFRVDGSLRIGGGHVMRCLTLARHLIKAGATAHFACLDLPPALAARVEQAGCVLHRLVGSRAEDEIGPGWEMKCWADALQEQDAGETLRLLETAPLVCTVVDHYRLDATWERSMPGPLLAVDDLANRQHACHLLLDQGFGRQQADYATLVPASCRILAGASYALLRPEFAAARAASLERRAVGQRVVRALVALGTTDVGAYTQPVVRALLAADPHCAVDVVLGADAPTLPAMRQLAAMQPRVALHVEADDMATLMMHADLAVGAGGTTTWERCALGVPTLTLVLAENQREVTERLAAAGVIALASSFDEVPRALASLLASPRERQRLSRASSALIDGGGAERVAHALRTESTGTGSACSG